MVDDGGLVVTAGRQWDSRIGQRVVVRYRLDDGGQTDVVGELTGVDEALHVASRHGPVRVRLDQVVAARVVPPRPTRPGPPHRTISITDLESVMALHWQALETERLGGWLLRASAGFTGRANSALPLGDPGLPVSEALDCVQTWYASRGLPAKLALAGPADGGVADDDGPANAARSVAVSRGWEVVPDGSALVMTARTADLRGPRTGRALPPGLTLVPAREPDDAWLANYRYRGQELPPAALALLRSASEQVFVSFRDADGATVAVARGSLGGGWAGLTAVEVIPEWRRRGLAAGLLRAVVDWAGRARTVSVYLQVAESNLAAQELYRDAGFTVHHRYDYLQSPPS